MVVDQTCVTNGARSDPTYHTDLGAMGQNEKRRTERDMETYSGKRWAQDLGLRPPLLHDTEKCREGQFPALYPTQGHGTEDLVHPYRIIFKYPHYTDTATKYLPEHTFTFTFNVFYCNLKTSTFILTFP